MCPLPKKQAAGCNISACSHPLPISPQTPRTRRHRSFGQRLGVKDSQILIMAHKKADVKTHKGSMPKSLSHVQTVSTTLEDNQSIIKEHFDRSRVCALVRVRVCMCASVLASLSPSLPPSLSRARALSLSLLSSLFFLSLSPSLPPLSVCAPRCPAPAAS